MNAGVYRAVRLHDERQRWLAAAQAFVQAGLCQHPSLCAPYLLPEDPIWQAAAEALLAEFIRHTPRAEQLAAEWRVQLALTMAGELHITVTNRAL